VIPEVTGIRPGGIEERPRGYPHRPDTVRQRAARLRPGQLVGQEFADLDRGADAITLIFAVTSPEEQPAILKEDDDLPRNVFIPGDFLQLTLNPKPPIPVGW
jgi:hypothetical protein